MVFGPGQLMHATHAVALGRMTCLAVCSTSFLLVLQQSVILKCNEVSSFVFNISRLNVICFI